MNMKTPAQFLQGCVESSQTAYDLLKELVDEAHHSDSVPIIRRFIGDLKRHCYELDMDTDEFLKKYHFTFNSLVIDGNNPSDSQLTLIQLPSTFTPEDWSFTFFEGLARYPITEFQGRNIAELGCGNGWITIALARKNLPRKIYGLDINPRAITCAKLNLFMNAFDDSGTPKFDLEGKTLMDRIEFHTSDLLSHVIDSKLQLDRVIGCIPQVLSPEALLNQRSVSEESDDKFLYSLSNYCEKQGYLEDQFGLGLIARALEEFIQISKPTAKIILNMGGRPGAVVLERLFTRRGFSIRKIWSTKVWQASDTDIQPLVDIEKVTPHRFEFFTSLSSDEPICAQTAQAYSAKEGRIAHSLSVYEAQLKQSGSVKSLFKLLSQSDFEEPRQGLDLSFTDEELADEKINFIGGISEWLQRKPNLPYSDTEGEGQLRRQIAQFLRSYCRIPTTAKNIFIAPNRLSIIKNHLQLWQPNLTFIEKEIYSLDAKRIESNLFKSNRILEVPKRVDEICKLIEKLKPSLVLTSLQDFEVKTSDAFIRLCQVTKANSSQLIIDLSEHFELSSHPASNGVFSYLADNSLPENVSLLVGLVRNKVYRDLELCFLFSENTNQLSHLTAAAELTYSRAPLLTQKYYSKIFTDLLSFQISDKQKIRQQEVRILNNENIDQSQTLAPFVTKSFQHPAIQSQQLNTTCHTIRLDYGENSLSSAPLVHSAIIESFLRQNFSSEELNVEGSILELASSRFGLENMNESSVLLGNGVAPIFAAALETITENQQKIVLPQGVYGYFAAACDFFNTPHAIVKTAARERFKMNARELDTSLSVSGAHWLYLNAPIVNPTGAVYSSGEIADLLEVLRHHNCGLILDTIFSGLEFNKKQSNIKLNRHWIDEQFRRVPIMIMGGLSKEFAAGGLRFGWTICQDETLLNGMRSRLSSTPHSTVRYAANKIYQSLRDENHSIHDFLNVQRQLLSSRCKKLSELLTELGWDVIESEGGLFVCASPRKYLEQLKLRQANSSSFNITQSADEIAQQLFNETGLLLNNATWTGLPSHLRFVVSVGEREFEDALLKLKDFDAYWQ